MKVTNVWSVASLTRNPYGKRPYNPNSNIPGEKPEEPEPYVNTGANDPFFGIPYPYIPTTTPYTPPPAPKKPLLEDVTVEIIIDWKEKIRGCTTK